jgi:hypothetical protein
LSSGKTLSASIRQLKERLGFASQPRRLLGEDAPLRAELYSADQMAQHGRALAAALALAGVARRGRVGQQQCQTDQPCHPDYARMQSGESPAVSERSG